MTGLYVVEKPWNQQPATRASALRVMQRLAPDLVAMLGLTDEADDGPLTDAEGRRLCRECGHVMRLDRTTCRRPECPAGPGARGGAR